jgi:hypothetical protein
MDSKIRYSADRRLRVRSRRTHPGLEPLEHATISPSSVAIATVVD